MKCRASVSEKDRRHFRLIAETEAELNRESIYACARRDPGRNVEIGLALSEFASSFGADLAGTRPTEARRAGQGQAGAERTATVAREVKAHKPCAM